MKWFQVDSDTPNNPKVKRLLNEARLTDPQGAARVIGHLFLVWCFVAYHGQGIPGEGVKADGRPLDLDDMAYDAMFTSTSDLRTFLQTMADRGLIDPDRWLRDQVVFLPAMQKRADEYAKRKGRGSDPGPANSGAGGGNRGKAGSTGGKRGLQDNTKQDNTSPLTPSGSAPPSSDLLAEAGEDGVDALVRVWNTERTQGPKVQGINPERRRLFGRALRAKPDLNDWRAVIRWLEQEAWANAPGSGPHGTWRASLDWLAKPGKLAEYLDKAAARPTTPDGTQGRNAAKGRTGFKRGEFAQALKGGGGGDGAIH